MPVPLSTRPVLAAEFEACVQKHSGDILAFSSLLLGPGATAEDVAVQSFTALHNSLMQGKLKLHSQALLLESYQECIKQCSRAIKDRKFCSSRTLSWEDRIVQALRYGLLLPLADISTILGKSVPAVKAQLRQMRERQSATPEVRVPSANWSAG